MEDIDAYVAETAKINSWQGITSVFALSSVLGSPIRTLWPQVEHPYTHQYSRICYGRNVRGPPVMTLMFTESTFKGSAFEFNHFVPLVPNEKVIILLSNVELGEICDRK